MFFSDILQETYSALTANKARSGLTVLGIVIGIASVIAMISIGEGAQANIRSRIEGLGSNILTITPGFSQQGRAFVTSGRGSAQTLKNEDAEQLKEIAGIAYISSQLQRRFQITSQVGNNTNTSVIGTTPEYLSVNNWTLDKGTFFTENQN
ncbi:MAG: ABC transporter permease, partial [candidate division WOR-3 bacterium]